MNPLEKLAIAVCQSVSKEGPSEYLRETGLSAADAMRNILMDAMNQLKSAKASNRKATENLIKRSIFIIQTSLKERQESLVQRTHSAFLESGPNLLKPNDVAEILNLVQTALIHLNSIRTDLPISHLEALCQFMYEFSVRFGREPDQLKGAEIDDLFCVSERIWDSENVQELSFEKRYQKYAELMTENVIGSHMVFEEDEKVRKTLYKTIKERVGSAMTERYSSHYVSAGRREEKHRCIYGHLFPITLMYFGWLGVKDGKIVTGKGASYWNKLTAKQQQGAKKIFATWRQIEARGGPDFTSWILHCIIDFPSYWILKYYISPERPQIAKHTSIESNKRIRGKPDTDPVFVRLNRKNNCFLNNFFSQIFNKK